MKIAMKRLKLLSFLVISLFFANTQLFGVGFFKPVIDLVDIKPNSAVGYQGQEIVTILVYYAPKELKAPQNKIKQELSSFFNRAFERSNENRADYILDLPFGSETSIYQYFKEQSGGKLSVLTSITSDKDYFLESKDNYNLIIMITDNHFVACKPTGGEVLVLDNLDLMVADGHHYVSGILNDLSQPYAWEICKSIGMFALDLPLIVQENMRESLLSYGLMMEPRINFGILDSYRFYRKLLIHPPNMTAYVRWKLGWVQMQPLSHMSMVRIGLLHEGNVIYKYEPNNFKVSDGQRDFLGIADYPGTMAGWQTSIDGDGNDQGGHDFLLLENRQDLGYEGGEIEKDLTTTRGIVDPDKLLAGNTVAPAEGIVIYEMSVSKADINVLGEQVFNSSLDSEVLDADEGGVKSALSKYFADLIGKDLGAIINPIYTGLQLINNFQEYFIKNDRQIPSPLPDCLTNYYPYVLTQEYVAHVLTPHQKDVKGTDDEDEDGGSDEKLRFGLIDPRGLGGDIGRRDEDFYPQMVDEPGKPQFSWRGDQIGDDAGFDEQYFPFISSRNSDFTAEHDVISGPVTEFGGYFKYVINSFDYLTRKNSSISKDSVSQTVEFSETELDYFTPTFSNISDVRRLMTAEVCSSDFYYNGEHSSPSNENGFLTRKFPNMLGISLKEDRYGLDKKLIGYNSTGDQINVPGVPLSESQYNNWKNKDLNEPTYRTYSIEMNMDYLQAQKDLVFGLWNKGGQHLPYEVTWGDVQKDGWFIPLKNPALSGDLIGNQSVVYRARLNMEYIKVLAGKMNAIDKPRYIIRVKLATVAWKTLLPEETEPSEYNSAYDIYVNIVMNAPAEMDFYGLPKDSTPASPVSLVLPIYAKGANGRAVIANRRRQSENLIGKSMLKASVKSNKVWLSPKAVADEAADYYVTPNGFSEILIGVKTAEYLDAGERLDTTLGDAELIATTDTAGVDLPNDSTFRTPVSVQVQNVRPPDPIVQQISTISFNIFFDDVELDDVITDDRFMEVNADFFTVQWNPARNTRFAFVYSAGESTTGFSNVNWQDISDVIDSNDDCVVDFQFKKATPDLLYSKEILEKFPQYAVDSTRFENVTRSTINFPDASLDKQNVFALRTFAINSQELEDRFLTFRSSGLSNFIESDEKAALMYLLDNKQSLLSDPNATADAVESIEMLTKIVANIYSVFDFIDTNPADPDDTRAGYTPAQKNNLVKAIKESVEAIKTNNDFSIMGSTVNKDIFTEYDQLVKTWQIAGLDSDAYNRKCFMSDDLSQPFGAIRRQVGAPQDLTASSEKEALIYLEWSAQKAVKGLVDNETTFHEIDVDDFSVWRSIDQNIDHAIELTVGTINLDNGSSVDDVATFFYSDRTGLQYPQNYYYWVKRVEGGFVDDAGLSNIAKGGLGEPFDGWFPIVDFIAEDFEVSEGVQQEDPADTRGASSFDPSLTEFVLHAGPVLQGLTTRIRFSATVSFNVDLLEYIGKDIQMNFDYKFKNLNDRSYLVVLVNGKQVYTVNSNESKADWINTGLVDITAEASDNQARIVIGLVSDSLINATEDADDQQLHLRAIKVGKRNYGPRWELLSVPTSGLISKILPSSITASNFLYGWDYDKGEYKGASSSSQSLLVAGAGYWIKSPEPLTSSIKVLSYFDTSLNNVQTSKLANVKTGWNLVGPVKKTVLSSGTTSPTVAYLNSYLGTPFATGTNDNPVLDCQIWYWNPQVKQYQPVKDELNIGEAYWIFKF